VPAGATSADREHGLGEDTARDRLARMPSTHRTDKD